MDHLPQPHRMSLMQELTFPLRCDPNSYDGGPLETYPERRGFRLNYWGELKFANTLTLPSGSRPGVEQSTALLQEWLFFGVLSVAHSAYGARFNGYDYIKVVDGVSMLTLKHLPSQADIWFSLEGDRPKKEQKKHFRDLQAHIMRALRFLSNNFTSETHGSISSTGTKDHVVHEDCRIVVESSLDILLLVLQEAMEYITKTIYFRERKRWQGLGYVARSTQEWMKTVNWCPSELNFIGLTFDNGPLCFANRLIRDSTKANHSRCTSSKCLAFDIKASEYLSAHADTCNGCSNISFNPAQLEEILMSPEYKGIPRVKISMTEQHEVKICYTDNGPYVAISHVWSDGLGHPPGVNALPECQIRRLYGLVLDTGLKEPVVWIDALCVPAQRGPGKDRALARMADIYRQATNVLVLDSDLLSIPSSSCVEELLLRIALCKWMRRLWTLEEGVVARSKLLFQFWDQAISLPAPRRSMTDDVAMSCATLISQYLPADADTVSVITSLQFRSTTYSADESLCIGYIMGIDVTSIIGIDEPPQRMAQLYRLLAQTEPKFPWQLLFTHEQKLNISPFRWAPASLLDLDPHDVFYIQGREDSMDNCVVATQTARGLQFQCRHSCIVSFPEGANINKCMILRIDALSYVVCPVPIGGKCRSSARFWEGADKERCLNADPGLDWTATWTAQYKFRPTGHWGMISSQRGSGYGVMVSIEEHKDKTIYARLVGQVNMYELRTEFSSIVNFNKELWGQLGTPALDQEKVGQEQDRVEREVFDERYYSWATCEARLTEEITWCVG